MSFSPAFLLFMGLFVNGGPLFGQTVEIIHSGTGISLRGLSAASDKVVWVSGNKGTVGLSRDGGSNWSWQQVPGYEDRDFRDIEAFDQHTAIVMAVGEPAVILKTTDGGRTWKRVYFNDAPGMFLDAMEFWNEQSGIVIGDPVNGRFFVARTFDGGFNWRALSHDLLPAADTGEACFAASGTNVRALRRDEACFVSGGKRSRFFSKGVPVELPITQGVETTGANSAAVWFKKRKLPAIVVVGGDYAIDSSRVQVCAVSEDGGKNWKNAAVPPRGYRSCVEFIGRKKLVSCGVNGVDISIDNGYTWKGISTVGFHVCRKSKKGKAVFLAGADGRIAKMADFR